MALLYYFAIVAILLGAGIGGVIGMIIVERHSAKKEGDN